MKYSVKSLPRSEVELSVAVEPEELEPFVEEAVKDLAKETEVPGFRKGEVPRHILETQVGTIAILERAAKRAVKTFFVKAVLEERLETVGPPEVTITKLAHKNPLEFTARVALIPAVILPDWRRIAYDARDERKQVSVSKTEIESALTWLRNSRAKEIIVTRPAKRGDALTVDFETLKNGQTLKEASETNYAFVLGKGKFLPGFEDAIEGMRQGEHKSFTITVPQTHWSKDLAGKTLECNVTVKEVRERIVPEFTDDFAKSLGKFANAKELRESVVAGIKKEKEEKERARIRIRILENIAARCAIEIPEPLMHREIRQMLDELEQSIAEIGLTFNAYLTQLKKTEEELENELRPEAERRTKFGLILRAIAKEAGIEPSEEEINTEANKYLLRFESAKDANEHVDPNALLEYTRVAIRNEKTLALIEQLAGLS